jgi:hypothetical protein
MAAMAHDLLSKNHHLIVRHRLLYQLPLFAIEPHPLAPLLPSIAL